MKSKYLFLSLLLFGAACGPKKEAKVVEAWWLTELYTPAGDTIESIPVKQLDAGWKKASVLTLDMLSEEGREYVKDVSDAAFTYEGDFNKDGNVDKALVGVFESTTGEKGRFLVILTKAKDGRWKKDFVMGYADRPGFSILFKQADTIAWSSCFECDFFEDLIWENGRYNLKHAEGEEVEGDDDVEEKAH